MDEIEIENAGIKDADMILNWRNDPMSLANSFSSEKIDKANHKIWFRQILKNANSLILIGKFCQTNEPIGMVRFETIDDTFALVSIVVDAQWRGRGLSSKLLSMAVRKYLDQLVRVLIAEVKPENVASQRCFQKSGFVLYQREDKKFTYVNKSVIIDEIEKVRSRNNVNWMDLMRLCFQAAPKEAEKIFSKINTDDEAIATLLRQLSIKLPKEE